MSAPLIGGVIGAAAGFLIPGVGVAIGYLVGSTLGGLLFPETVEYPGLEDLKIQDSTYGRPIPRVWGTMRVAPNVIYQMPELTEHQDSSGGKGGPEVKSKSYSTSWATAWCGNEINAYKRLWANGRVVWDQTQGDMEDVPFTRYYGTEDQMPDPTMESIIGAGLVTAHRGTAYTMQIDWQLGDYGNSIPFLEAEIQTGSDGAIPWRVSEFDLWQGSSGTLSVRCATYDSGTITASVYDDSGGIYYINVFSDVSGTLDSQSSDYTGYSPSYPIRNLNSLGLNQGYPGHWFNWNGGTNQLDEGGALHPQRSSAPTKIDGNANIYQDGIIYTVGGVVGGVSVIGRWSAPDKVPGGALSIGYFSLDATYSSSNIGLGTSDTGHIYVMCNNAGDIHLWQFHPDGTLVNFWDDSDTGGTELMALGNFHVYKGQICYQRTIAGDKFVSLVKINDDLTLEDFGETIPSDSVGSGIGCLEGGLMFDEVGVFSLDPPVGPVTLATIVGDIAAEAGDSPDVSALTDIVDGYILNAQMSAKAAIDGLRPAFAFDGAEVDDEVVFVKRGGASVATITLDELAARDYGGEAPVALKLTRTPDSELPRSVTVKFINGARDYQIDSQPDRREVTSSTLDLTYELPVNMTAGKARAAAKRLLYEAWVERDHYTFSTHRKYARLTPTDVVTVDGIMMRIEKKTEAPNGVITFEAVATLAEIYTQSEDDGIEGSFTPQEPPAEKSDSSLVLFDLPLADDDDAANGIYVGMAPAVVGPWVGATLYRSTDGGTTYGEVLTTDTAAVMGTASLLGDFTGGNVFDESNVVEVVLLDADQSLESSTELAVLNGANLCVIGRELLQFRTATLTAPGTYQLSGLRRGRRGTEWAISGHTAGDVFALMSSLIDVSAPLSDLGATRHYKAVTIGKTLASATAQTFVNQGMRVKPYSPAHIGGGTNAAGDTTINWAYRALTGGAWNDLVDVAIPAGLTTIVEIRNASFTQVARVITVTGGATTCAYSAADQVTDFGDEQATIYCTVAVVGAYGLGTRGRGVIDGGGPTVDEPLVPVPPYGSPPGPAPGPTNPTNTTLAWDGSDSPHVTAGYVIGDAYVVEFTTDADPVGPGNITAAEYGSPAYYRTAILATDSGGVGQVAVRYGNTVDFIFGTGSGQVSLSAMTTYYLIIRTQLPDGTPSSPLGSPANMIISF